jgi:hypothetical protein
MRNGAYGLERRRGRARSWIFEGLEKPMSYMPLSRSACLGYGRVRSARDRKRGDEQAEFLKGFCTVERGVWVSLLIGKGDLGGDKRV